MQTFSFNPPINLLEEGKWLLAVTSLECTNSVFNITNENNSFAILTIGHWKSEDGEELFNKLNEKLKLRSENYIDLYVYEVEKRVVEIEIEIENRGYTLAAFDQFKCEILAGLKRVKYMDLEDMVYRMLLTCDEIVDKLDVNYIAGSTKKHSTNYCI